MQRCQVLAFDSFLGGALFWVGIFTCQPLGGPHSLVRLSRIAAAAVHDHGRFYMINCCRQQRGQIYALDS